MAGEGADLGDPCPYTRPVSEHLSVGMGRYPKAGESRGDCACGLLSVGRSWFEGGLGVSPMRLGDGVLQGWIGPASLPPIMERMGMSKAEKRFLSGHSRELLFYFSIIKYSFPLMKGPSRAIMKLFLHLSVSNATSLSHAEINPGFSSSKGGHLAATLLFL